MTVLASQKLGTRISRIVAKHKLMYMYIAVVNVTVQISPNNICMVVKFVCRYLCGETVCW